MAVTAVWDKIKDPEDETAWMVCGMDPEDRSKTVVQKFGRCGLDKVRAALREDEVQFAVFRVWAVAGGCVPGGVVGAGGRAGGVEMRGVQP
jgi:hypothetical protein